MTPLEEYTFTNEEHKIIIYAYDYERAMYKLIKLVKNASFWVLKQ